MAAAPLDVLQLLVITTRSVGAPPQQIEATAKREVGGDDANDARRGEAAAG
jgi:hypothetical protein